MFPAKCATKWNTVFANMAQNRSQVIVEGEPSMSTYTDAEGNTKSSLNIVQRMFTKVYSQISFLFPNTLTGSIETLRRPTTQE